MESPVRRDASTGTQGVACRGLFFLAWLQGIEMCIRDSAKTVEDRAVAQLSAEEHVQLSGLLQRIMQTLDVYVTER